MGSRSQNPIEHIVVLMFENRSYDNVLGMLYNPKNPAPYNVPPPGQTQLNGLNGTESNEDPMNNNQPVPVWGASTDADTIPAIDPGEPFKDMAQQILGLTKLPVMTNPYPTVGPYGAMGGFLANYETKKGVNEANVKDVMHYILPQHVPITAWLANRFAVCDHWFASVPTQTFANRMFSQCAAAGVDLFDNSYLDDFQYAVPWAGGGVDVMPNVFSQLDDVLGSDGPNWKLYFHDYSINAKLLKYLSHSFTDPKNVNLANYNHEDYPPGNSRYPNPIKYPTTTFLEDIQNGTLAPFSLIEPRYSNNYPGMASGLLPNSNHPGGSNYVFAPTSNNPPISVTEGERLLLDVFAALRTSQYWANTLLIVTYDEHGGCFDHVNPLQYTAIQPGSSVPAASNGFDFNYFGGRVPTVVISPYIAGGTTLTYQGSTPFDHTSIIKTVWDCFNLSSGNSGLPYLNQRDKQAPSIMDCLMTTGTNNPTVPRFTLLTKT